VYRFGAHGVYFCCSMDCVLLSDCYKCGEEGHMSRDCPKAGQEAGRGRGLFICTIDILYIFALLVFGMMVFVGLQPQCFMDCIFFYCQAATTVGKMDICHVIVQRQDKEQAEEEVCSFVQFDIYFWCFLMIVGPACFK